jgi:L,D-peptidoglycan transpeptidase YkuD (ErfK/YbiS/YcfS/YnhG family)
MTFRPIPLAGLLALFSCLFTGCQSVPDAEVLIKKSFYLKLSEHEWGCVLGRNGVTKGKREGDGRTPVGILPVREVWYRADRLPRPQTALPVRVLQEDDGWCDDPTRREYNRPVKLPFSGSHERLWREDSLYDIIVVLGWNDKPVRRGRGSAIFLHVAATATYRTAGCLAMRKEDLLELLKELKPGMTIRVNPPEKMRPQPAAADFGLHDHG